jgi:hypothetical protein
MHSSVQPSSNQALIQKLNHAIELTRGMLQQFPQAVILLNRLNSIRTQALEARLAIERGASLGFVRFAADWAPLNSPIITILDEIEQIYQRLALE